MNRFALLAVAIIAIVIAWFVFFAGPTVEPPPPVAAPTVQVEAPPPVEAPPVEAPPPEEAPPPPPAAADAAVDAEAQSGPVTVDLGRHEVMLAERDGRYLKVRLTVVAADNRSARLVRLKRSTLIRGLFFLVSKRSAEGVEAAGGRQRLIDDLTPRFANFVRSAQIERIELPEFEVVEKALPRPDGGP